MGQPRQMRAEKNDAQLIRQSCAWLMRELGSEKDRFIQGLLFAIKTHPNITLNEAINAINSNKIAITGSMGLLLPQGNEKTAKRRFDNDMREVLFSHVAAATVIGCIYHIDPRVLITAVSKECPSSLQAYQNHATVGKGAMQLFPGGFAREFARLYAAMKNDGIKTGITKPIEDTGHPNKEATGTTAARGWDKAKRGKMNAVAYDTYLVKRWLVPVDFDKLKETDFTKDSFLGQNPFANMLGGMLIIALISARGGYRRSSFGNENALAKIMGRYNSVHPTYGSDFVARLKQMQRVAEFIGWKGIEDLVPTQQWSRGFRALRPTRTK